MPAHIDATIDALVEPWFLGPEKGPKYGNILLSEIRKRNDAQALDKALELGNYLLHTKGNKQHRHAVRATMLAAFVMKKQPLSLKDGFKDKYDAMKLEELKQAFVHQFPAIYENDNRADWDPVYFTNPSTLRALFNKQDWRGRAVPAYRFMVHTVRHGAGVLNNPLGLLGWTAISMSVLASSKPLAYSNHGLILRVPKNNIITTSPTDQWFDNYAGTAKSKKAPGQSMADHIAEKNLLIGGLLTPDEVAARQNTDAAMAHFAGAARTQHNEVIVTGLAAQPLPHGNTGVLQLLAYFIETKMDGTLPANFIKSQGPSDLIEIATREAARNNNVPLLYLPSPHLN